MNIGGAAGAGGMSDGARQTARRDLAIVGVVVLVYHACAVALELSERLARWTEGYEAWQLDELSGTLLVISLGLAWFAFRRMRDARREADERRAAACRITQLLAQNRDLTHRVIVAQEAERRALARDLHDEIGQSLTALRAEASWLARATAGGAPDVGAAVARMGNTCERLHGLARDLLRRLRPPVLDSLGLAPALQELCRSFEERHGVACACFPAGLPESLDDYTAITLYRLVQESLTNVARHAAASRVTVTLRGERAAGLLRLVVEDDGRGMARPEGPYPGFGLNGMHERVASLHGELTLTSARGLRLEVRLPLDRSAA